MILFYELVFATLLIVTAATAAGSVYFWYDSSRELARINDMLQTTERIKSGLAQQLQFLLRAHILQDEQALRNFAGLTRTIDHLFNKNRQLSMDREEDVAVQVLQQQYRVLQADMYRTFRNPQEQQILRVEVTGPGYGARMMHKFNQRHDEMGLLLQRRSGRVHQRFEQWKRWLPVVLPSLIFIGLVVIFITRSTMRRQFVQPMSYLARQARHLSGGALGKTIPEEGVAETREMAKTLNIMSQELERSRHTQIQNEKQAAMGALVPVIAHNIRNPLASVRATAQLLDARSSADEVVENRSIIIDTVDQLGRWLNSLVSYLHPLQPRLRSYQATSLFDDLMDALPDTEGVLIRRGRWQTDLSVRVDPDLMEQALYGLLANAIDASPPEAELLLEVYAAADQVILLICDNGKGLPFTPKPADLTPGPSTKHFGTGLGIPIAFKICQSHGWELFFEPRSDNGTQVRLIAPRENSRDTT